MNSTESAILTGLDGEEREGRGGCNMRLLSGGGLPCQNINYHHLISKSSLFLIIHMKMSWLCATLFYASILPKQMKVALESWAMYFAGEMASIILK